MNDGEEALVAQQKEFRRYTKYHIDRYVSFIKLDHKLKCFISSLENSTISKSVMDAQSDPK